MFPFVLLQAAKGSGKTKLARDLTKELRKPNGGATPFLEVNCATIKKSEEFFTQIFNPWKNNDAMLFLDEAHCLPVDLQQMFLSVMELSDNPIRTTTFNHKDERRS